MEEVWKNQILKSRKEEDQQDRANEQLLIALIVLALTSLAMFAVMVGKLRASSVNGFIEEGCSKYGGICEYLACSSAGSISGRRFT